MSGNENSGRIPEPLERQQLKAAGDGLMPSGHRLTPKGTEIAQQNTSPDWIPPDPPLRRDGKALVPQAQELHTRIWLAGKNWMHEDKDFWWTESIARNEDQMLRNAKRIAEEGEMGYFSHMGEKGGLAPHPLLKENRDLEKINAGYFQRNGFDAASRAKLQIADVAIKTGIMDFMDRVDAKNKESDE